MRRIAGVVLLTLVTGCGSSDEKAAANAPLGDGGLTGTGGSSGHVDSGPPAVFAVTSEVFADGETIAQEYRCVAPSPDLEWTDAPTGTEGFAVILQDVTPGFSNGVFHWLLYDLSKDVTSLPKGVEIGYAPPEPAGSHQGKIWNGTAGFNGPCGGNNTYELTVYALSVPTLDGITEATPAAQTKTAVEAAELARTKITILSHP